MMTATLYNNGFTMGTAGGNHNPPKRGQCTGWNADTARRFKRWLYRVKPNELPPVGYAFTLTVKDCPETAKDWARVRDNWIKRMRREGMECLQWLTEWQRRGVPHLHGCAYFPEHINLNRVINHWLDVTFDYETTERGQNAKTIDGVQGWLQYQSKHCGRGVAHYQRQAENIPKGWQGGSIGRVWGASGNWSLHDGDRFQLPHELGWQARRIVRALRVSSVRDRQPPIYYSAMTGQHSLRPIIGGKKLTAAEAAGNKHSKAVERLHKGWRQELRAARRMLQRPTLRNDDGSIDLKRTRNMSAAAGVSEWSDSGGANVLTAAAYAMTDKKWETARDELTLAQIDKGDIPHLVDANGEILTAPLFAE